jgi:sterol desaturase/sphingolipid hydroxylase (fatty acid hydroxylase superfamily)
MMHHVHYIHHGYRCIWSWAGALIHPVEDLAVIFCNTIFPIYIHSYHPIVGWAHALVFTCWLIEEHSGYDVWWAPYNLLPNNWGGGAAVHDLHHSYNTRKNFGFVVNFFDILFGTDTPSKYGKGGRHWKSTKKVLLAWLGVCLAEQAALLW